MSAHPRTNKPTESTNFCRLSLPPHSPKPPHGFRSFARNSVSVRVTASSPDRSGWRRFFKICFSLFRKVSPKAPPKRWIVGIAKKTDHDFEAFGFQLARVLIGVTQLGLGTVPLGGTFSLGPFASELSGSYDAATESIPIVMPVGIPDASRTGLMGAVVKWIVDPRSRKEWPALFFDGKFGDPLSASAAGQYADALDAVRLAPSAVNKQPWSVVREGQQRWHFTSNNATRLARVDLGIAMGMFTIAAEALGLHGNWQVLPEPPASICIPVGTVYVATWIGQA